MDLARKIAKPIEFLTKFYVIISVGFEGSTATTMAMTVVMGLGFVSEGRGVDGRRRDRGGSQVTRPCETKDQTPSKCKASGFRTMKFVTLGSKLSWETHRKGPGARKTKCQKCFGK